jgi:hypothetical protein
MDYGMSDDEVLNIVYCIKETPIEDCVMAMRKFADTYEARRRTRKQLLHPNLMHMSRKFSLYQVAESIRKTISIDETLMETKVYDPDVAISYTDSSGLKHKIIMGLDSEQNWGMKEDRKK